MIRFGKQLKTMGLLVITDAMINRVNENWRKGKRTHIILDEFHVVFENEVIIYHSFSSCNVDDEYSIASSKLDGNEYTSFPLIIFL